MRKKILSILLAVVMLASVCSMMIVPVSAATTLSTDNSGAYLISSAADVETFRLMMVGGETFLGKTVKLTADIDMKDLDTTEKSYVYTMDATQGHGFYGTFDGQGNTIGNLTVSGTKNNGFFGFLSGDATNWKNTGAEVTIKNLAFVNATTKSEAGVTNVGLLYGAVYGATVNVDNLYVDVTMLSTHAESTETNHGGLVGYAYGMAIEITGSYINVVTSAENSKNLNKTGLICGCFDNNNVTVNDNKLTVTESVLTGNLKIKNSYILCGGGAKQPIPDTAITPTRVVLDITHNLSVTGGNTYAKGLWKESKELYYSKNIDETATISDFDATDVEGFTKTIGYMVPTTLLALFPQHCLEEETVDGGILELQGYQTKGNDIRLVATIADKALENYKALGFEVVVAYGGSVKSQDVEKHEVYSSICANSETGDDEISASELIGGDGYIFALHFRPTHTPSAVTFQVRMYYVDANNNRTYGSTEVFTVTEFPDGTVVGGQLS